MPRFSHKITQVTQILALTPARDLQASCQEDGLLEHFGWMQKEVESSGPWEPCWCMLLDFHQEKNLKDGPSPRARWRSTSQQFSKTDLPDTPSVILEDDPGAEEEENDDDNDDGAETFQSPLQESPMPPRVVHTFDNDGTRDSAAPDAAHQHAISDADATSLDADDKRYLIWHAAGLRKHLAVDGGPPEPHPMHTTRRGNTWQTVCSTFRRCGSESVRRDVIRLSRKRCRTQVRGRRRAGSARRPVA